MRMLAFFNTKKESRRAPPPRRRSFADPSGEINNTQGGSDTSGIINNFYENNTLHVWKPSDFNWNKK